MSFFQGASNIRITGGEFNNIKGNYTVYDQSRHHTNKGSFNTTNTTVVDSFNNRSVNYNGVDPRRMPPLPRPSKDDQSRSGPTGPHDFSSYFPPPVVHPAMMQPEYLPPGSRTENNNAFNVHNDHKSNIHNNYSQNYGPRPTKVRPHGRWNRPDAPASDPQVQEYDNDEEMNSPYSSTPPQPANSSNFNPNFRAFDPMRGGAPYVNGHRPGTHSSASYSQGDVRGFSPQLQQTFEQLMQQLHHEVAEEHPMARDDQRLPDHYDDDEQGDLMADEDEDEDEVEEDKRMSEGMADLSLNDELRPAFSRVKSDPQRPLATAPATDSTKPPLARMEPRHAKTAQAIPQRLREPFVRNTPSASSSEYPRSFAQAPQAVPSSVPTAFGISPSSIGGGPVFRDIHGDYTKVDNSVNTTNIDSGNTYNSLVKDSYNDHSINANYTPEEATRTGRRQGRVPRK